MNRDDSERSGGGGRGGGLRGAGGGSRPGPAIEEEEGAGIYWGVRDKGDWGKSS